MSGEWFKKYRSMPVQIRASFWFLVCSFLQKAISALTTPIFTRLLTSSEYGQFNVFLSWQSILRVVITLNLYYGVYTSGLIKYQDRRSEFVSSLQGLTLTLVLFWLLIYLAFTPFFNSIFSLSTPQMLGLLGQLWTTAVFSFWAAEQRVEYKYQRLVAVTLLVSVAKPVLGVILVLTCADKVTARILGLFAVELVAFGWMLVSHVRRDHRLYSKEFWRYALAFNIPLIPHYLAQNILNNSDRIMIGRMVSDSAAGIYSLAYTVALTMNLFNTALSQTIGPWVYGRIKANEAHKIESVLLPSIWIIAAVNILLIAFAPEIIRFFAPPSYYEAIWTIPPVVMSVYFMYLYDTFSYYEFYYEKTAFIAVATTMSAAINVLLNYICIRRFGYIAAGYTTLSCFVVYAIGHYFAMRSIGNKYLDRTYTVSTKNLLLTTLSFLVLGSVFCVSYTNTVMRYLLLLVMLFLVAIKHGYIINMVKGILEKRKG